MSKDEPQQKKLKQFVQFYKQDQFIYSDVHSQFKEQYGNLIKKCQLSDQQIEEKLALKGIIFSQQHSISEFRFQVMALTNDDQIFKLKVDYGQFSLYLLLVNVFQNCSIEFGKPIGSGQFANIYSLIRNGEQFVIKVFSLKNIESRDSSFIRILKELSIMKICSALGLCPSAHNYLGFDLVVFDDLVFFTMERGRTVKEIITDELLQLLSRMHLLQIIHFDIKPQNLIFSPSLNKVVFIDFGLSNVIAEKQGQKTLTNFKGTPEYSSKQMVSILTNGSNAYIDLYHNDLHGLIESIKVLQGQIFPRHFQNIQKELFQLRDLHDKQILIEEKEDDLKSQNKLLIFIFKSAIVREDYHTAKLVLNSSQKYLIRVKTDEVKLFFKKINFPNKQYLTYFQQEIKNLQEITQFNSITKDNYFVLKSMQVYAKRNVQVTENNTLKQSFSHIKLASFNRAKAQQSDKNDRSHFSYQQLLRKQLYINFPFQYHLSLFDLLRFDIKSSISFETKTKLALSFIIEILPNAAFYKQINVQKRLVTEAFLPFLFAFEQIRKYFDDPKVTHQKENILYQIFYQFIIIDENIHGQLQQSIQHFLNRKQQRLLDFKQLSNRLVWVNKYFFILKQKANLQYNKHKFLLIEYFGSYIQKIHQKMQEFDYLTLRNQEQHLRKLFINLIQIQKDSAIIYDSNKISEIMEELKLINNSEIKIYLQYEFYNYFAEHSLRNYCFSEFSTRLIKIIQIIVAARDSRSNNYFYFLIVDLVQANMPLAKYFKFSGEKESINHLLKANSIETIFVSNYAIFFTEEQRKKDYPKMLNFYNNLKEHLFKQNQSKYLKYQFYLILSTLNDFLVYQKVDLRFYRNFSDIAIIVDRYFKLFDLEEQIHGAIVSQSQIQYRHEIINFLCNLAKIIPSVSYLIDNYIVDLYSKLAYHKFDQAQISAIVQMDWGKQIQYLQYLKTVTDRANSLDKNQLILQCYEALLTIYYKKGWIGKMLESFNNRIIAVNKAHQIIFVSQCDHLYKMCVANNAVSFLLQQRSLILSYVIGVFIEINQHKLIADIFRDVFKELETVCSPSNIMSLIGNIQRLLQAHSNFFESTNIISIYELIPAYCKYRVILLMQGLQLSTKMGIKDENYSTIQTQIKRVIWQVRPVIRHYILKAKYCYMCKMHTEPPRKESWLKLKKGPYFMFKQGMERYFKSSILRKVRMYGQKKRILHNKLSLLCQYCVSNKNQTQGSYEVIQVQSYL